MENNTNDVLIIYLQKELHCNCIHNLLFYFIFKNISLNISRSQKETRNSGIYNSGISLI